MASPSLAQPHTTNYKGASMIIRAPSNWAAGLSSPALSYPPKLGKRPRFQCLPQHRPLSENKAPPSTIVLYTHDKVRPSNRAKKLWGKIRANRFWNVYYLRLWFLPRRCCTIFHSLSKYFAHSTQWNCPRPGLSSSGTKALSWASCFGLRRSEWTWSTSLPSSSPTTSKKSVMYSAVNTALPYLLKKN